MQLDHSKHITFLLGNEAILLQMEKQRALPIFSGSAVEFLQATSERLLKDPGARPYPDVVTFAFWCRRASVHQMQAPYREDGLRLGKGVTFHIAPSNVAVNFAYSFAAALLAGNACIVRVPSKPFAQVEIICNAMKDALAAQTFRLEGYICLVSYGHEKEVNDAFSSICDTRVIWGGDRTIQDLRRSPLKPRANEITFADRHSIAVIQADAYLAHEDKERLAQDFYNDTYLSDQNACTSPRVVVWMGEEIDRAQELFWGHLQALVRQKYRLQPVQAIDKLTKLCLLGEQKDAAWTKMQSNHVVRASVGKLEDDLLDFQGNSGFFVEYRARRLEEILPVCNERCQTLSYFGLDPRELQKLVETCSPRGIDRIVPIGRTMDFSLVWDGHDLIREMSRRIQSGM